VDENLDEIVAYASEKNDSKPKRKIGQRVLEGFLALSVLAGGVAAAHKAYADTKDGYQIAQVVNDIDLSEFTKLEVDKKYENLGLDFYISTMRTEPNNKNKKTNPDWHNSICFRFYNLLIVNNSNRSYTIEKLETRLIGTIDPPNEYTTDQLAKAWGNAEIPAGEYLLQPDRGSYEDEGKFPLKAIDNYILRDSNGKISRISVSFKVK